MAKRKATAPRRAVETKAGQPIAPPGDSVTSAATATPAAKTPEQNPAATNGHVPPAAPHIKPRSLDVFLVDSGWDTPVGTAVRENIPAMAAYLKGQQFFVLNREQSLTFLQRHPALVGADPVLLVLDRKTRNRKEPVDCGFRLCLGHVKQPEVAVSMLKWAVQLTMTASAAEMLALVRQTGQRESLQGVIELMGESTHLLEFAPL
jgi:hypothetical protein